MDISKIGFDPSKRDDLITVTSPLLPDLGEFTRILEQIWENRWITNNGPFHQQLEQDLQDYLKVDYLSLFTNGTLPLITALQALQVIPTRLRLPSRHVPRPSCRFMSMAYLVTRNVSSR